MGCHRGRGIGKLLLVAALAYSSIKNGKSVAVLTLGSSKDDEMARNLYDKLGFEAMPEDCFGDTETKSTVDPSHVMVLWDIKRSLKSLTLADVDAASKGSRVAQLQDGGDHLKRLDSATCQDVV